MWNYKIDIRLINFCFIYESWTYYVLSTVLGILYLILRVVIPFLCRKYFVEQKHSYMYQFYPRFADEENKAQKD